MFTLLGQRPSMPRTNARAKASFRPRLEVLEDRFAPALLPVANLNDSGTGSLREAIALANAQPDEDQIVFAPELTRGILALTTVDDVSVGPSAFAITSLTIEGTGQTLRRADGVVNLRLFVVSAAGSLTLKNLMLADGLADGNDNGSGFTFGGGEAGIGGAVFVDRGALAVVGCTLLNNHAVGANGVLLGDNGGTGAGGALFNVGGTVTLTNCTLSGNTAVGGSAGLGGVDGQGLGGAVFNLNGLITLTQCTVTGNFAATDGGGLFNRAEPLGFGPDTATATFVNSIVYDNANGNDVSASQQAPNAVNTVAAAPNIFGSFLLLGDANYAGVSTADPLLGSIQDNGGYTQTIILGVNSPALNIGTTVGTPFTDQRGAARDLPPDLGAYEVQHPLSPVGVPVEFFGLYSPHPSGNATEAYVKGLYLAALLRPADAGGLSAYVNALTSGALTRAQVVAAFINSPENRTNQVTFFYRYFLGREPDQGGLDFYVNALRNGADEADVMLAFLLSPESTGNNPSQADFVNTLYFAILGRQADTGGFNAWTSALNSAALTRHQVAGFFIRSPESVQRYVRSLYRDYLKRNADAGGLNAYTDFIRSGASFSNPALGMLISQEFFNNAAANL